MTRQRNKARQKGKRKTKGNDKQGKTMNNWAYKTRSKIILKMPKAEIPNRNSFLRSNPLVLFRRPFKG
jgi:hypothetical protein